MPLRLAGRPEPPLFDLPVMYFADPPAFPSLAPTPALRRLVMSSWPALAPWLEQLKDLRFLGDDDWPSDLIDRADAQARRPIADVAVHLEMLPIAGLQHWILTEDRPKHLLHALVAPDVATHPRGHDRRLLDALIRIG